MQVIITETDKRNFEHRVQMKLNDGYKVVPNTTQVALAVVYNTYYNRSELEERYVTVLEK